MNPRYVSSKQFYGNVNMIYVLIVYNSDTFIVRRGE